MEDCIDLPPGFRFHPTDEEIITHYLSPKVVDRDFVARAIGEVDLNKCEPWDLPGKAKMEGKEMYFFCQRDRKYPTGMRTNRATESGYWKATGKDKEIYRGKGVFVGMKKTLVFYRGRAPKGEKTNWVMHEFRLEGKHSLPKSAKDEWAVCRVFHKNLGLKRTPAQPSAMQSIDAIKGDHELEEYYPPLPALTEPDQFIDLKANYYLPPTMMSTQNQQAIMMNQMITSSNLPHNSFLQQAAVLPPHTASSYSSLLGSSNNLYSGGYLHHQDQALLRSQAAGANYNDGSLIRKQPHCKVEQYSSNQSLGGCPSQDTALSTDRNTTTDISSVISSGNYDNFDDAWTSYAF